MLSPSMLSPGHPLIHILLILWVDGNDSLTDVIPGALTIEMCSIDGIFAIPSNDLKCVVFPPSKWSSFIWGCLQPDKSVRVIGAKERRCKL